MGAHPSDDGISPRRPVLWDGGYIEQAWALGWLSCEAFCLSDKNPASAETFAISYKNLTLKGVI